MDPWLLAALVLSAYMALVLILKQTGLLARANIQAFGPFLVWRTARFRAALDRLAKSRRLWSLFARASVALVFVVMGLMVVTLLVQTTLLARIPPEAVNPQYAIGIPGVNPIIPLGLGILGLAVAILVHEGCHGVLARVEGIKVRSVGLLLVLFPIGAFVEPDEQEMRAAPLARRQRIYAVGPSSNIVLGLVCALIFSAGFVGSLEPVDDGVMVTALAQGGPAAVAGIAPYTLITAIENATSGPVEINDRADFDAFMANATPGENVTLTLLHGGERTTRNVTLAERTPPVPGRSRAILGVNLASRHDILMIAGRPGVAYGLCGASGYGLGSGCYAEVTMGYVAMPLNGLSPVPADLAALYRPTGPMAALGGAFWWLADAFYWLFWLNIMVGSFNALPLLPLDGGHMYRDGVLSLLRRRRRTQAGAPEQAPAAAERPRSPADDLFGGPRRPSDPLERRALSITKYTSLAMFVLIMLPFIVPRLLHGSGA